MNLITQVILILFLVNTVTILILSVLWKNKEVNLVQFVIAGSSIYRELPKYLRKNRIKPYLFLSYSAILFFMLFILSMVLSNI